MAAASPWPLTHAEREALAADLTAQDGRLALCGPEVPGPALPLVMAMTGRAAALGDLSGDGLATLRSRF